jgi:hypothetical protein
LHPAPGVCTPLIANPDTGRCLGIPNTCPGLSADYRAAAVSIAGAMDFGLQLKQSLEEVPTATTVASRGDSGICFGGKCDGAQKYRKNISHIWHDR